jgi:transcriptional regulator with XRE-family HTH domain
MIGRKEGVNIMPIKPFNERLKELRSGAGMTQEAVARAAGLSTSTIAKLEHAGVDPSWSTVVLIAKAIGVGVGAFETDAAGANAEEQASDAAKRAKRGPAEGRRRKKDG